MLPADYIWTLVSKKLANEASEKELLELKELLVQYSNLNNAVSQLYKWWYLDKDLDFTESHLLFDKIKKKINKS